MQQVLIIHGGETFRDDASYVSALASWEVSLEPRVPGWKDTMAGRLGEGFEVIVPSMPCKQHARYLEWKIWFEKYLPFLRDGVVLVGHSLGGIFLAKYLSEQEFPVRVRATVLVGAPFCEWEGESLADFVLGDTLELLAKQGGEVMIYHSEDDPVVPFSHAQLYAQAVPESTLISFTNRGHFNEELFPELEDRLRDLARKS